MKRIDLVAICLMLSAIVVGIVVMAIWNRDSHGMRYKVVDYTESPNGLWSTYYTDNASLTFFQPFVITGYWRWKSWNPGTLVIPANHTLLIE